MDMLEFHHAIKGRCVERSADCTACDLRLFCYTPPCERTDEMMELVTEILTSQQSRTESQNHSDHRNGGPRLPCPCEMDMSSAPGYELRQ